MGFGVMTGGFPEPPYHGRRRPLPSVVVDPAEAA